jgi:pyrroloquinoline quinone biosynthesis protein B
VKTYSLEPALLWREAMVVQILGSAAGGGVPQWNCACRQCDAARAGLLKARTQCSVAISADERRWVLVNASPDLRSQLTQFRPKPRSQAREAPIEAILLTDADLDHTLGLFLLRENEPPVSVYALDAIKEAVEEGLRMTDVLNRYCGIRWITPPLTFEPLLCRDGTESGLEYKAVEIAGPGPRYRRDDYHSCRVFYVLRELATGRSVLLAPAVAELDSQLLLELSRADAILLDGTFWANDDFEKSGVCTRSIAELLQSHLPISNGSLKTLAAQPAKHKIYIHINNTNPVLWDSGPERQRLEELGIEVATDGMTIEL